MTQENGNPVAMTPRDLQRWRFELDLSQARAGWLLDLSSRTITAYEIGEQPIPRTVDYACRWLFEHRDDWQKGDGR